MKINLNKKTQIHEMFIFLIKMAATIETSTLNKSVVYMPVQV